MSEASDDVHDDNAEETCIQVPEREEVRLLWDYTLGRPGGKASVGEFCESLSQWGGHRDWARAICTLLPSRRCDKSDRIAATLPRMIRASRRPSEDPHTMVVRRQLSSATHRRRPASVCLNRALSMRSPTDGYDGYDSVFEPEGEEEPLSEQEQAEMRAAIRNLPVPLALRRIFRLDFATVLVFPRLQRPQ